MKKQFRMLFGILCALVCAVCLMVGLTGCSSHTHLYASEWSADDSSHWKAAICGHDNKKSEKAPHVDENEDGECDICHYFSPEHTWSDDWDHDDTYHWRHMTCAHTNLKIDKAQHTPDESGNCTVCHIHCHKLSDYYYVNETEHWREATCGHPDVAPPREFHEYTLENGTKCKCGVTINHFTIYNKYVTAYANFNHQPNMSFSDWFESLNEQGVTEIETDAANDIYYHFADGSRQLAYYGERTIKIQLQIEDGKAEQEYYPNVWFKVFARVFGEDAQVAEGTTVLGLGRVSRSKGMAEIKFIPFFGYSETTVDNMVTYIVDLAKEDEVDNFVAMPGSFSSDIQAFVYEVKPAEVAETKQSRADEDVDATFTLTRCLGVGDDGICYYYSGGTVNLKDVPEGVYRFWHTDFGNAGYGANAGALNVKIGSPNPNREYDLTGAGAPYQFFSYVYIPAGTKTLQCVRKATAGLPVGNLHLDPVAPTFVPNETFIATATNVGLADNEILYTKIPEGMAGVYYMSVSKCGYSSNSITKVIIGDTQYGSSGFVTIPEGVDKMCFRGGNSYDATRYSYFNCKCTFTRIADLPENGEVDVKFDSLKSEERYSFTAHEAGNYLVEVTSNSAEIIERDVRSVSVTKGTLDATTTTNIISTSSSTTGYVNGVFSIEADETILLGFKGSSFSVKDEYNDTYTYYPNAHFKISRLEEGKTLEVNTDEKLQFGEGSNWFARKFTAKETGTYTLAISGENLKDVKVIDADTGDKIIAKITKDGTDSSAIFTMNGGEEKTLIFVYENTSDYPLVNARINYKSPEKVQINTNFNITFSSDSATATRAFTATEASWYTIVITGKNINNLTIKNNQTLKDVNKIVTNSELIIAIFQITEPGEFSLLFSYTGTEALTVTCKVVYNVKEISNTETTRDIRFGSTNRVLYYSYTLNEELPEHLGTEYLYFTCDTDVFSNLSVYNASTGSSISLSSVSGTDTPTRRYTMNIKQGDKLNLILMYKATSNYPTLSAYGEVLAPAVSVSSNATQIDKYGCLEFQSYSEYEYEIWHAFGTTSTEAKNAELTFIEKVTYEQLGPYPTVDSKSRWYFPMLETGYHSYVVKCIDPSGLLAPTESSRIAVTRTQKQEILKVKVIVDEAWAKAAKENNRYIELNFDSNKHCKSYYFTEAGEHDVEILVYNVTNANPQFYNYQYKGFDVKYEVQWADRAATITIKEQTVKYKLTIEIPKNYTERSSLNITVYDNKGASVQTGFSVRIPEEIALTGGIVETFVYPGTYPAAGSYHTASIVKSSKDQYVSNWSEPMTEEHPYGTLTLKLPIDYKIKLDLSKYIGKPGFEGIEELQNASVSSYLRFYDEYGTRQHSSDSSFSIALKNIVSEEGVTASIGYSGKVKIVFSCVYNKFSIKIDENKYYSPDTTGLIIEPEIVPDRVEYKLQIKVPANFNGRTSTSNVNFKLHRRNDNNTLVSVYTPLNNSMDIAVTGGTIELSAYYDAIESNDLVFTCTTTNVFSNGYHFEPSDAPVDKDTHIAVMEVALPPIINATVKIPAGYTGPTSLEFWLCTVGSTTASSARGTLKIDSNTAANGGELTVSLTCSVSNISGNYELVLKTSLGNDFEGSYVGDYVTSDNLECTYEIKAKYDTIYTVTLEIPENYKGAKSLIVSLTGGSSTRVATVVVDDNTAEKGGKVNVMFHAPDTASYTAKVVTSITEYYTSVAEGITEATNRTGTITFTPLVGFKIKVVIPAGYTSVSPLSVGIFDEDGNRFKNTTIAVPKDAKLMSSCVEVSLYGEPGKTYSAYVYSGVGSQYASSKIENLNEDNSEGRLVIAPAEEFLVRVEIPAGYTGATVKVNMYDGNIIISNVTIAVSTAIRNNGGIVEGKLYGFSKNSYRIALDSVVEGFVAESAEIPAGTLAGLIKVTRLPEHVLTIVVPEGYTGATSISVELYDGETKVRTATVSLAAVSAEGGSVTVSFFIESGKAYTARIATNIAGYTSNEGQFAVDGLEATITLTKAE